MNATETTAKHIGAIQAMLDMDKTQYQRKHPTHTVVYNANVLCGEVKTWHGDLDVTAKGSALQALSDELKCTVYVLHEHDARFTTEDDPVLENAVARFVPSLCWKRYTFEPYGIVVTLFLDDNDNVTGTIEDHVKGNSGVEDDTFNAAVDGITSLMLAHACAGVDLSDESYVEGVKVAIEACSNNL